MPIVVHAYLEKHTKAQLIELIETLARRYSEVNEYLQDRCKLATGDTKGMVAAAKAEIGNLDTYTDWEEEDDFAVNFSRLKEQLEALLAHGRADQVLALGKQLLEAGKRHHAPAIQRRIVFCQDQVRVGVAAPRDRNETSVDHLRPSHPAIQRLSLGFPRIDMHKSFIFQ